MHWVAVVAAMAGVIGTVAQVESKPLDYSDSVQAAGFLGPAATCIRPKAVLKVADDIACTNCLETCMKKGSGVFESCHETCEVLVTGTGISATTTATSFR